MNEVPVGAPMPTSSPKSLWIVVLVVVVAALALLFIYFTRGRVNNPTTAVVPGAPKLKVAKTDLAADKVPDKFPQELLALENGSAPTQNYNASAPDGRSQATRAFELAPTKTLADEIKIYHDFLAKNGWSIQDTLDQNALKVVIANKKDTQVLIVADENATTHVRTVTVTATAAQPLANSSGN